MAQDRSKNDNKANAGAPSAESDEAPAFAQRVEEFAHALQVERNASPHTIRNYTMDLHDFGRWAKRSKTDALSPTHRQLRRYLANLDAAQYSRSTVNRRLSSLRSFFRWQILAGYAQSNPADALCSIKKDKTLPHRIRPEEMAAILKVWGPLDENGKVREQTPEMMRNQALLEFLYACGARISEASGLLAENVDFEEMQVRVLGKGNKERIIPIHRMALESMRSYLDFGRKRLLREEKPNPYFFVSPRGGQWGTDAIRKTFRQTLQRAGVSAPYTPHDMRHTFASDILEGGADLRSVQEMLGHSSLSTTQIYTHLSMGKMKEVHRQAHPRG